MTRFIQEVAARLREELAGDSAALAVEAKPGREAIAVPLPILIEPMTQPAPRSIRSASRRDRPKPPLAHSRKSSRAQPKRMTRRLASSAASFDSRPMVRLVRLVRIGGFRSAHRSRARVFRKDTIPASGSAAPSRRASCRHCPSRPRLPSLPRRRCAGRPRRACQGALARGECGRHERARDLRTDPEELPRYNAFLGYINTGATNANIVETCLSMFGDAEPRVRSLAAQCVAAGASRVLAKSSPLRAAAIAATLDGLERDPHAGVRLQLAYVLGSFTP